MTRNLLVRTLRVLVAASLVAGVSGCGDIGSADDEGEGTRNRLTQCGPSWDGDPVESPSDDQLVSPAFIVEHSPAAARARMPGGLCSGTLISNRLFMLANHCLTHGGGAPTKIEFNYQKDPDGKMRPVQSVAVESVVEAGNKGLDYAIVRLKEDPGIQPAKIASKNCAPGEVLAIIGHPHGRPKEIATGHVGRISGSRMYYGDLDTLGGNSGSGILCASNGKVTGVHAWGGCRTNGGANSGTHIEALLAASPTLRGLTSSGPSYVPGLARKHLLDSKGTGKFDKEVCSHLSDAWKTDPNLRIRERSFGFAYYHPDTPCGEIKPLDRWLASFEGYLKLTLPAGSQGPVKTEFNADVNDGVRLVVMNESNTAQICRMEMWQDVPEYDNYHSTDAYDPEYGCTATLTPGVYYPMKLEAYHQSDASSRNRLFNRAYLDMFYWGLPRGARIEFFRLQP